VDSKTLAVPGSLIGVPEHRVRAGSEPAFRDYLSLRGDSTELRPLDDLLRLPIGQGLAHPGGTKTNVVLDPGLASELQSLAAIFAAAKK
jgi:hypothetical protein